MLDLFSDDARRDPYPIYAQLRDASPVMQDPRSGLWMVFDYEGVRRVLTDHETFSSRHGLPEWLVLNDPPRHSKLRALVARAFTPRSVAELEPRIAAMARELLDAVVLRGAMDVATDFAVPLPMRVIATMFGVPPADVPRIVRWNDVILNMSYTVIGSPDAAEATANFIGVTAEMDAYLAALVEQRRGQPADDLLTRLLQAEVDGERLTQKELLGFFQLLLLAGSETTTNLINNAILCFVANPDQLARLYANSSLLALAIEEILRYRSPLQWMYRVTRHEVELHGRAIPAGKLVLAMIGSANHDPSFFADPERFDVTRDPNPHLAFGHGIHFCLGAPLARLEARVALSQFLERVRGLQLAGDGPWRPRRGLHVHGPERLPIRFAPGV